MRWRAGVAIVLVACSDGGVTGKAPPQAILDTFVGQGEGKACESDTANVELGQFSETQPISAIDGSGSGANSVACTVRASGGSFEVTGEIKVDGDTWLAIAGTVPGTYDKAAKPDGVPGLRVTFSNGERGSKLRTYEDDGCLLQYKTDAQGATSGRIWGHLTCSRGVPEGGDATKACSARVQFRFENCGL